MAARTNDSEDARYALVGPQLALETEIGATETGLEPLEERYVPAACHWRVLEPWTCFFKVHGAAGGIPALTEAQWRTLAVCCLCGVLFAYDIEVWPVTLPQIQRDLNVSESNIGLIGSAVRMGNAFSWPVSSLGDAYGRKRVMLIASTLYMTFMVMTSFATSALSFAILQVLSRAFMAAQNTLSTTLIVESLNSDDRGWGIGVYSAIGVLGSAACLVIFGLIGDLPSAWRWLYAISAIPFIPVLFSARKVPESRRFVMQKNQTLTRTSWTCDKTSRIYSWRMAICFLVSILNGMAIAPAEIMKIKKLIDVHGLSAANVAVVQVLTGAVAFASFTVAGSLSDRFGRKRFLVVFNTMCMAGIIAFFLAPAGSNIVYVANFISILGSFVLSTVKATYFAELFPTSRRSTAQGMLVVCEVFAGGLSLVIESSMYSTFNQHWIPCAILATPALFSGPIIGVFLPEVSSKELETISPESFEDARPIESAHIVPPGRNV